MQSLTPDTNIEQLRRRMSKTGRERKRQSEKRRNRLERLARWISGKKVKVFFQPSGAKCQEAHENARHDLEIYIPTEPQEQTTTNIEPVVWDFVFQKAELVHELGHVMYTDFAAFEDYVDKISDMHRKGLFRNLFNILEDGAIERQLAAGYNVGNDLEIKNRNLLMSVEPGTSMKNGQAFKFHEAIGQILMDWAKWDSGRADKLLDPRDDEYVFIKDDARRRTKEVLPLLKEKATEVVNEPDGEERIARTYEMFEELKEHFEEMGEMTEDDLLGAILSLFPDDGRIYVVQPGGDPPDDAEYLEPDEDDVVIFLDPPEGEEEDPEQKYGKQVEADDEGGDEADEYAKWAESVERQGAHLTIADPGPLDQDNWNKGKKYGRRYKQVLQRMLQQERASDRSYNERAGRPDTQNLWQLGYGNTRVFTNEREPEEKDYSVVILLDRSGSMGGDNSAPWIVDEAEAVTVGLTKALEELGAEVAIISAGGTVELEKPFTTPIEKKKSVVAKNQSNGGTPLGSALKLATDRLDDREGKKLVFSITDGYPSDSGTYTDTLQKVTFPVVGAYFGPDTPNIDDVRDYYHRITTASKEDLAQNVEGMIKRMVV